MSKLFDHLDSASTSPPMTAEERLLREVRHPVPRQESPRPDPVIDSLTTQLSAMQSLAEERQQAHDQLKTELEVQRDANAAIKAHADKKIATLNQALAKTLDRPPPSVPDNPTIELIQSKVDDLEFQIDLLHRSLRLSELRREQQQAFAREERDRRRHGESNVLKARESG